MLRNSYNSTRVRRRAVRRASFALAGLLVVGCTVVPPEEDGVLNTLAGLILVPGASCDQLQDMFDVGYLPVAGIPTDAGVPFEEHWLPVGERDILHVWYLPAELDRGLVVLSPGSAGPMNCYLFPANLLVTQGWSVVIYEYEGYGYSSGTPSFNNLYRDLQTAFDWALLRTGRSHATLMGVSLGSIPSVALAVDRPERVNGLVLDSPVALGAEFARFGLVLGNRPDAYKQLLEPELVSDELIKQVVEPLLVFAHGRDLLTPPSTVQSLFDAAPGEKRLVFFNELNHARGVYVQTTDYAAYLDQFLSPLWK